MENKAMNIEVGTLVVGKKNNGYSITGEDALLEVLSIQPNGEFTGKFVFTGKLVAHAVKKYMSSSGNSIFDQLPLDDFEIPTIENINRIKGVKPVKDKPEQKIKFGGLEAHYFGSGRIESNFYEDRQMRAEGSENRALVFKAIRENYSGQKSIFELKDTVDLSVFDDILGDGVRIKALDRLVNFFIEFQFTPSLRFANTLAFELQKGNDAGVEYVKNYFNLIGSPHVAAVTEKMKAPEFEDILNTLGLAVPSQRVNKRLKIYMGAAGTGKTYTAMHETNGRCIICNSSILPQDLLDDFAFEDGKPGFNKSILRKCMEEGLPITLDEINLLPMDTIRFAQGILDDKNEFIWKGETIKIKEGFQIIGTMNLVVNNFTVALPDPIADRAIEIKEYKLTGKDLLKAIS